MGIGIAWVSVAPSLATSDFTLGIIPGEWLEPGKKVGKVRMTGISANETNRVA